MTCQKKVYFYNLAQEASHKQFQNRDYADYQPISRDSCERKISTYQRWLSFLNNRKSYVEQCVPPLKHVVKDTLEYLSRQNCHRGQTKSSDNLRTAIVWHMESGTKQWIKQGTTVTSSQPS